jgi:transcriptional regulator with XRE-family HTH domain
VVGEVDGSGEFNHWNSTICGVRTLFEMLRAYVRPDASVDVTDASKLGYRRFEIAEKFIGRADEPQTVELLQSMRIVMRWLSGLPPATRRRFLDALAQSSDELQGIVFQMVSIVENPRASSLERQRALKSIVDVLVLNPGDEGDPGPAPSAANGAAPYASADREVDKTDCQEVIFAERLRALMAIKCVTQEELSHRVGCSQPAVSQMLNRKCRPQKKTILKLAEALHVEPQELWPDMEVADMLDAVADFGQDDHVMTEAEAKALRDTASRNTPKIPVRPLPTRKRGTDAEG